MAATSNTKNAEEKYWLSIAKKYLDKLAVAFILVLAVMLKQIVPI